MKPSHKRPLYIGIADFESSTLLIAGDSEALLWFASQLESGQSFEADHFPLDVKLVDIKLHLNHVIGVSKLERHNKVFDWKITTTDASNFSEQLRALAMSSSPAHAYLDTPNDFGIDIVASKDEYTLPNVYGS